MLTLPLKSLQFGKDKCGVRRQKFRSYEEYHKGASIKDNRLHQVNENTPELKLKFSAGGRVSWHNQFEKQRTDENLESLEITQLT